MSNFIYRHIGTSETEQKKILNELNFSSLDEFITQVIPQDLVSKSNYNLTPGIDEDLALDKINALAKKNKLYKIYAGLGYFDTITPAVIRRNVLENPGWYTAYTPYQAEISQGRLEALHTFQQMVCDLTGFNLANASLLDEGTAAAEAMNMAYRINSSNNKFLVSPKIYPQTLSILKTRAKYLNLELVVANPNEVAITEFYGLFIQNPDLNGEIKDYSNLIYKLKTLNPKLVVVAAIDILSLVLFKSAKAQGIDIACGSTQRFGVPIGFGGPSAAYLASDANYKRLMPGRIIGVSQDSRAKKALRMSLQTREQHIRREKATSNICTSQVLLANMAAFYAQYHGVNGLRKIALKITYLANYLVSNLQHNGINLSHNGLIFDTVSFSHPNLDLVYQKLLINDFLVSKYQNKIIISLGERANLEEIKTIINLITNNTNFIEPSYEEKLQPMYREDAILTHENFNRYHSESLFMRYLKKLENRDISLVHSMIALGSCTMKLNSACSLEPLSNPHFTNIHPFTPKEEVKGYLELIDSLSQYLKEITGFDAISMQPNSGAQGEYAGLLAIRRYFASQNQTQRTICLIPKSAHGTNPASAQIMGLEVVVVNCDSSGNIDLDDLKAKLAQYGNQICALMVTYPSTHGVFETTIKEVCSLVHQVGAQVYLDGANLNAMVGLIKVAELGADVSHINLHKTFAIPHGGGGPGMGPIGVKKHLAPFLPQNPILEGENSNTSVAFSPYGSASILSISWMYITMLGLNGLQLATKIAILNANYIAYKLIKIGYHVLYRGQNNLNAHECIVDLREIKANSGITEVDFAKRLMDYGFHSPTMSFPVPGTLMIEPTESESLEELDRFILAMEKVYIEVTEVINGKYDKNNNPLKNAPHTLEDLLAWDKPYSPEIGIAPMNGLKDAKILPYSNRIDDAYGDRNFICQCLDLN